MVTTHEAMKTYYFRTRTGEIRGVTTKTYITPGCAMIFFQSRLSSDKDIVLFNILIMKNQESIQSLREK